MELEPLTPERRRQQTRDTLVQAAAQVFAERGFHGASLDEVAAVAGFTKGAVYSNFKGKDDLFLAVFESRYERHLTTLYATIEATEGNHEEHLADFVDLIGVQFTDEDGTWGALFQEFCLYAMRNPEAKSKLAALQQFDVRTMTEIIETERKRHGIETGEPAEHQAFIVVALFQGLYNMRLIDPTSVDEPLLETTMAFVTRAMLDPPD